MATKARLAALFTGLLARDAYYGTKRAILGRYNRRTLPWRPMPYRRSYYRPMRRMRRRRRTGYYRPRRRVRRTRRNFSIARQRRQIGRPVGVGSSRTQILNEIPTNSSSRNFNLVSTPLTEITQAGSAAEICVGRLSNKVFVSGFRICMQVNLKDSVSATVKREPFVFNFAVVSAKRGGAPTATNFLRGEGEESGINLDTQRNGMQLACASINTDLYSILMHKRIKLWNQTQSSLTNDRARMLNWGPNEFWIPLRRQLTFEDQSSSANDNIYIVHWGDFADTQAFAASVTSAYDMQLRVITYYRNMIGGL